MSNQQEELTLFSPTCATIDNRLWVSPLSSTLERIDPRSWDLRNPLQRFTGFSDRGVPLGIDWSRNPGFYEFPVHWRGYLPIDALIEPEWENSEEHILSSGRNGFIVKAKVADWRNEKTTRLRKEVDELTYMLDFESHGVPFPSVVDTSSLSFVQPTRATLFRAMAISRAYYLDLVGYYCWVRRVFDEAIQNRSWDLFYPADEEWSRWWNLREVVGYLIDFHSQWKIHSAPMWEEHAVPFHYVWDEGLSTNERFRRWDPASLEAYDETTGESYDTSAMSSHDSLHSGTHDYDSWLQANWAIEDNSPVNRFEKSNEYNAPSIRFCMEDFEGWRRRPLIGLTASETALLSTLFYYEDIQDDGSPYRKFLRWRARIEDPYSTIEASITEPFRLATYVLRETYKFRYAGYQDGTGSGRSLLSRIGGRPDDEDSSPVIGYLPIEDPVVQARQESFDDELRLQNRRDRDRLRSASPNPSRASSGSQSSHRTGRRERDSPRESYLGSHQRTSASSTDGTDQRDEEYAPVGGRALVESLLPAIDEAYPPDLSFQPRWSRRWLANAVIHFENPKAEWRIRAWLIREPNLTLTSLLTRAVTCHIPFSLEIPADLIPQWSRPVRSFTVWEVNAGVYYTGVPQARPITYNADGSEYAREYQLSVMEVLNRPNSTAFFFEGGLLARLALHYGHSQLLARAMEGPSAAMTLHGAGHTDFSRATRRESVTDPERNVLLGQSKPGTSKSEIQYIWPPVVIFQAKFQSYDGRWTDACENWFQERVELIKGGFVDAKTESGWWSQFRRGRRSVRITNEQWTDVEAEIVAAKGGSWEGKTLNSVFNLDAPGNDYMNP